MYGGGIFKITRGKLWKIIIYFNIVDIIAQSVCPYTSPRSAPTKVPETKAIKSCFIIMKMYKCSTWCDDLSIEINWNQLKSIDDELIHQLTPK